MLFLMFSALMPTVLTCMFLSYVQLVGPIKQFLYPSGLENFGSVTVTVEVGTNGATTLSRMNFSGYVGHVTTLRFS